MNRTATIGDKAQELMQGVLVVRLLCLGGTGVMLGEEIGALRIGGVLAIAAGVVMVLRS